jgi:hypothetical protein
MYRCEAITPDAWASLAGQIKLRELYLNRFVLFDLFNSFSLSILKAYCTLLLKTEQK